MRADPDRSTKDPASAKVTIFEVAESDSDDRPPIRRRGVPYPWTQF
jgi:hypothetical protein